MAQTIKSGSLAESTIRNSIVYLFRQFVNQYLEGRLSSHSGQGQEFAHSFNAHSLIFLQKTSDSLRIPMREFSALIAGRFSSCVRLMTPTQILGLLGSSKIWNGSRSPASLFYKSILYSAMHYDPYCNSVIAHAQKPQTCIFGLLAKTNNWRIVNLGGKRLSPACNTGDCLLQYKWWVSRCENTVIYIIQNSLKHKYLKQNKSIKKSAV